MRCHNICFFLRHKKNYLNYSLIPSYTWSSEVVVEYKTDKEFCGNVTYLSEHFQEK